MQRHSRNTFRDLPSGPWCYVLPEPTLFLSSIPFYRDTRWNACYSCGPGSCIGSWSMVLIFNLEGYRGSCIGWGSVSQLLLSNEEGNRQKSRCCSGSLWGCSMRLQCGVSTNFCGFRQVMGHRDFAFMVDRPKSLNLYSLLLALHSVAGDEVQSAPFILFLDDLELCARGLHLVFWQVVRRTISLADTKISLFFILKTGQPSCQLNLSEGQIRLDLTSGRPLV